MTAWADEFRNASIGTWRGPRRRSWSAPSVMPIEPSKNIAS